MPERFRGSPDLGAYEHSVYQHTLYHLSGSYCPTVKNTILLTIFSYSLYASNCKVCQNWTEYSLLKNKSIFL